MGKEKLEKKIAEQIVCPDCGKAIDYKDIGKYKRGVPADLMGMDFMEFLKQKTGVYQDDNRDVGAGLLKNLGHILYDGRLYKETYFLPNDKYRTQWHVNKIAKVKDLYSLTKGEIHAIQNIGKKTWDRLNEILSENQLHPLTLPYEYTVTYPLKKK